jgi:hypothetical protein
MRVPCTFKKKHGFIVLDQIRTIDKERFIRNLGVIDSKAQLEVVSVLQRNVYILTQKHGFRAEQRPELEAPPANRRSARVSFREYSGMYFEMYPIVTFQNVDKNSGP